SARHCESSVGSAAGPSWDVTGSRRDRATSAPYACAWTRRSCPRRSRSWQSLAAIGRSLRIGGASLSLLRGNRDDLHAHRERGGRRNPAVPARDRDRQLAHFLGVLPAAPVAERGGR